MAASRERLTQATFQRLVIVVAPRVESVVMAEAGIVPYLVQLDQLRAFAGCKDIFRARHIVDVYKSEIADNSAVYRQAIADGAPTLARTIEQICMGEPLKGFGAQYVYGLELLCAHFGGKLRNSSVYPSDDDWLMRVLDPIFDAWKLGEWLSFKRLVYGAWPVKLPHADFPRGGTVEADAVQRTLQVMRAGALPKFDKEVVNIIGEVRGWIEGAAAKNAGIVCFYY
jgi:hypothetical protein